MVKKARKSIKWLLILSAVVVLFGASCGTFLYLYNDSVIKTVDAGQTKLKTYRTDMIKAIAANRARVIAAKAAATAEAAKSATPSTANTVDSSTCNTSTTHNDPSKIDVLVNKKHCIQPVTYIPSDLVAIDGGGGFVMSAKAAPSFNAMYEAAAAAGEGFSVTSSYRSYSDQVSTYAYWVGVSGKDGADTYSARPGYSEHQTGYAVDVEADGHALSDFLVTSQYTWLKANAASYGFIQRYPDGYESITGYETEEWHYRYVGVDVAEDMIKKSIPTLEQYWNMTGGDY